MAMAPWPVPNLPPSYVFRPKARELIQHYLAPKALGGYVAPGLVAEGVDVFSAAPDALPFSRDHRRENGEVWGYFFAAHPAGERAPAPGGCWLPYGPEKAYRGGSGGRRQAQARVLRRVAGRRRRRRGMGADALADGGVPAQQGRRRLPLRGARPRGEHGLRGLQGLHETGGPSAACPIQRRREYGLQRRLPQHGRGAGEEARSMGLVETWDGRETRPRVL